MKVAYLTTYYNGAVDGRFGRFHDWAHRLRDRDDPPFESTVVALTASNPDGTLSSPPCGVLGDATELWGTWENNVEFALNVPRAVRDLSALNADVIHVLTLDVFAYPVALARADRSPVIGPDVQGYFPGRRGGRWRQGGTTGLKHRFRHRLRGGLLSLADDPTLVTLSRYHAHNVRSLDSDRVVRTIPPGVSPVFRPNERVHVGGDPDRPTRLLYLGDLSAYKGYDLFLEALSGLPDKVDVRATIVGTGDPQRGRIDDLGLAERVEIAGFVDRAELPEYYRWADCYVMPSVDEHGPNTIVEALACGTPVVATDRPGTNEYADDAAIYVDRSVSGLQQGITEFHDNREEYVREALAQTDEYRADRVLESLTGIYQDHIERTGG